MSNTAKKYLFNLYIIKVKAVKILFVRPYGVYMSQKSKDEQIKSYIETWLKNQYSEFFLTLIADYEPNEVNPTMVVDLIIKLRFQTTPAYIKSLGQMSAEGVATREQQGLYFAIQTYKKYAIEYNRSLQKFFDNIYNEHQKIGTPLGGIFFHIYCFLKFGIKAKSAEHDFSSILNFLYTSNESIMDPLIEKSLQKRVPIRSSKNNKSRAKTKWMERVELHNYSLKKRKIVLFKN